jgi:hypothetical protein
MLARAHFGETGFFLTPRASAVTHPLFFRAVPCVPTYGLFDHLLHVPFPQGVIFDWANI